MFTIEDLNNLKAALVSGISTVTVNGRSQTFRSKQEILELIKIVEDDINGVTNPEDLSSFVIGGFNRKGE